jgi:hypothetical protein
VDDVTKEEPNPEMREHQASCSLPMGVLVGFSVGWRHRSIPSALTGRRRAGV